MIDPPFPINHTALGCRGGCAGAAFREQRLGMRSPTWGDGKGDPSPTPAVSHVCRTLKHESPLREHIEPFLSLVSFFFFSPFSLLQLPDRRRRGSPGTPAEWQGFLEVA